MESPADIPIGSKLALVEVVARCTPAKLQCYIESETYLAQLLFHEISECRRWSFPSVTFITLVAAQNPADIPLA